MNHSSGELCCNDASNASNGSSGSNASIAPQTQSRTNTRSDSSSMPHLMSHHQHRSSARTPTSSNSHSPNGSSLASKKERDREIVSPLSLKEACADGSPPPPLSLHDRV